MSADGELGQGGMCARVNVARAVCRFFFPPLPVFLPCMCCRLTGGCVAMCLFLSRQRSPNICPHVQCVIDDRLKGLNSDFVVSVGCTAAVRSVAKWLKQGHVVNLFVYIVSITGAFFSLLNDNFFSDNPGDFQGNITLFIQFHLSLTRQWFIMFTVWKCFWNSVLIFREILLKLDDVVDHRCYSLNWYYI